MKCLLIRESVGVAHFSGQIYRLSSRDYTHRKRSCHGNFKVLIRKTFEEHYSSYEARGLSLNTIWMCSRGAHVNLLKPTGHVIYQQFNIQQLHALPTLYLCVLFLSENKQRLVPLTA
jgi:hypothetical protein